MAATTEEHPEPDDLEPPDAQEEGAPRAAPHLDEEARERRAAALAHVRLFGDPVLKSRALPVERFDETLREEVARMGQLMHDAIGVGLAATQLGVMHRLLVYRVAPDAPIVAVANPEVEWSGKARETLEEGCLSLPGIHVDVERPIHVRIGARDERGEGMTIEATGLEARVLQHEIDHLDGVLMLERTSRDQRKEAMRTLREAERIA